MTANAKIPMNNTDKFTTVVVDLLPAAWHKILYKK